MCAAFREVVLDDESVQLSGTAGGGCLWAVGGEGDSDWVARTSSVACESEKSDRAMAKLERDGVWHAWKVLLSEGASKEAGRFTRCESAAPDGVSLLRVLLLV